MYLGSIEEEGEEAEAVTEAVTGVDIVAEEGDTVPTGAPVDVAEDVVSNPWSLKKAVVFRLCSQL